MFIVSIKPETGGEASKLELSDGSFFLFRACYLPPNVDTSLGETAEGRAAEGREISDDEEAAFRFAAACLRTEKTALRLLARAEQNTFGLSRKLEKRGYDPACVRAVLEQLGETGLLDDRRYARLWLETRLCRQSSGPWRLLAALRSRGIDSDDAEAALKESLDDETEFRLLLRYTEKFLRKHKTAGDSDEERRALKYTLKREGFSPQNIQRFFDSQDY